MGLLDFAADIGKKLFGDDEDDAGGKIQEHIQEDNPGVEDLKVVVEDGVAKVSGKAEDQSAWEKAILMAGNVFGINEVQADELEVPSTDQALRSTLREPTPSSASTCAARWITSATMTLPPELPRK